MLKGIILPTLLFFALVTNASNLDIFDYIADDNYEKIIEEIESGVDVNVRDYRYFQNTPLIEISYKGGVNYEKYLYIAELLLLKGADVNTRNIFGTNAVFHATKLNSNADFLKLLTKYGADLKATYNNNGETLLHAVMENSYYSSHEILSFLIEKTQMVNVANSSGFTPLMMAMTNNCRHYEGCGFMRPHIRILVEAGADINAEDKYFGFTALEFGIDSQNETASSDLRDFEFLLEKGAKVTKEMIEFSEDPEMKKLLAKYLK